LPQAAQGRQALQAASGWPAVGDGLSHAARLLVTAPDYPHTQAPKPESVMPEQKPAEVQFEVQRPENEQLHTYLPAFFATSLDGKFLVRRPRALSCRASHHRDTKAARTQRPLTLALWQAVRYFNQNRLLWIRHEKSRVFPTLLARSVALQIRVCSYKINISHEIH